MAERDPEVSHATALELQRLMAELKGALREQQHMQGDLSEMRQELQSVIRLLREGNGGTLPLTMRMTLVERAQEALTKRFDDFREAQRIGRDWWMKVLGNLTVSAFLGVAGILLSLYMLSKQGPKLP